jgi:hypothetical protein
MSATTVFNDILSKAARAGVMNNRTKESNDWLMKAASSVSKARVDPSKMLGGNKVGNRMQARVLPGHMYMFTYDPKTKETLPYWDRFPLIFPYKRVPGGFMGLNLHYLPYRYRALLMDALSGLVSNQSYDETTKIRLSYNVLNQAAKYRYFKPCVKHYLDKHVTSRFIYIYPTEWQTALFLPTERFQKATTQRVWQDSIHKW